MFNDRYGLTQAVLDGRKTQTRRIITCPKTFKGEDVAGFHVYRRMSDNAILEYPIMYDADERDFDGGYIEPKYKVGEVVAVAQSYKEAGIEFVPIRQSVLAGKKSDARQHGWTKHMAAFNNKMFTAADILPHRIRITDVRVERLNDISETDCRAEGVDSWVCRGKRYYGFFDYSKDEFVRCNSPREAYAALIDRISGKGVWQSNPWVFAYTFELVK